MKKIALVTLYGNSNFGNKLQNYAIQKSLEKYNYDVITLRTFNSSFKYNSIFLNRLKYFVKKFIPKKLYRNSNFKKFEKKYINCSKSIYFSNENNSCLNDAFSYFIIGSDQVWSPNCGLNGNLQLLDFTKNKIAFSASFGVSCIPEKQKKKFETELKKFIGISVREEQGKKIIYDIDKNIDVSVLVDPTMLLTADEWDSVSIKPKVEVPKKYILNYFLGDLSEKRKKIIYDFAKKNNCEVINILDKNDKFYLSGPSEFLYLEKNAFLICTDSFHSSVFAILYDRPFIVFEREDNIEKMNSRIDTLINKFKLENRRFNGSEISKENIEHNYINAYKILEKERKKSVEFLIKSLSIR